MANDDGSAFIGPDAVVQNFFMSLATDWDGIRVTPGRIPATETGVISEGRYRGVYKTTGVAIDSQFAHVWQTSAEEIKGFQQYTDTAAFRRAIVCPVSTPSIP
jgi:ketosteroid isomerase-like protein